MFRRVTSRLRRFLRKVRRIIPFKRRVVEKEPFKRATVALNGVVVTNRFYNYSLSRISRDSDKLDEGLMLEDLKHWMERDLGYPESQWWFKKVVSFGYESPRDVEADEEEDYFDRVEGIET